MIKKICTLLLIVLIFACSAIGQDDLNSNDPQSQYIQVGENKSQALFCDNLVNNMEETEGVLFSTYNSCSYQIDQTDPFEGENKLSLWVDENCEDLIFSLDHPFSDNLSEYIDGNLIFMIKTATKNKLKIGMQSQSGDEFSTIWTDLDFSNYGFKNDDRWRKIVIPVNVFNKKESFNIEAVTSYFVISIDQKKDNGVIELDQIYLEVN